MQQQDAAPWAVEMRGVTKRFPGVVANDRVSLQVRPGEVHALLGENGAGKTTLMNILSGLYQPDAGEVWVEGRPLRFGSPRDSIASGIGVIHQHFHLVEVFTVLENVTMGRTGSGEKRSTKAAKDEIQHIAARYGWKIDPDAHIWQLGVGERQRVEILKALYRGARTLVLDEPTAVLTPQEAEQLALTLRQMAGAGQAVIYISHKLKEVMGVADRITILRGGRNIGTVDKATTSPRELARLMVGRDVAKVEVGDCATSEEVLLDVRGIEVAGDLVAAGDILALRGLSLDVRAGQILGLAGVSGNGQRELAEAVAGLRPVRKGQIFIAGRDMTNCDPRAIIDAGFSLIPEDRLGVGLVGTLTIEANAMLKAYRLPPIAHGPLLDLAAARRHTERLVKEFNVSGARLTDPIGKLSGGNLQRLLLAREILGNPRVMIAVHPTRGLDVQATADVHRLLLQMRDNGAAILLISEDLDELLALSDCVAVIHDGKIMGRFDRGEVEISEIGLLMAGTRGEEVHQ